MLVTLRVVALVSFEEYLRVEVEVFNDRVDSLCFFHGRSWEVVVGGGTVFLVLSTGCDDCVVPDGDHSSEFVEDNLRVLVDVYLIM